jgi:hypothetical protein
MADITKATFAPNKHYNSVLMQQGRVQLDSDWNEQLDIQRHRDATVTADIVGQCGAPQNNAGFGLTVAGNELRIGNGHYWSWDPVRERHSRDDHGAA